MNFPEITKSGVPAPSHPVPQAPLPVLLPPGVSRIQRLTATARDTQETGVALLLCVLVLGGLIFFFPDKKDVAVVEPVAEAPEAPDAFANIRLEANAAIVYDLATGRAIYERNSKTQLPLASLTKLLTAYAASDALFMNGTITLTESAISADGDSGLTAGESFTTSNLAKLALVASSNDAAAALAEAAAGSKELDAEAILASAARAVGLSQTYAVNGTGLDESTSLSGGYGSAHDVALLAGAIVKKMPDIAEATTRTEISVTSREGVVHTLSNTDTAVERMPNLLLSKTGYTDLAGGNLAIVFDASFGHPVAVVVLGSTRESRFTDVDALVTATLAHFANVAP